MNIPLDRLYHFIDDMASEIYGDPVLIYRFWPHGSKNIKDLFTLSTVNWDILVTLPSVWCHDQEPLDYEFYKTHLQFYGKLLKDFIARGLYPVPKNLNFQETIFEKGLLLHSEKRSNNLKKYQLDNELIPVYYWSHAVIARDWFRYAEHENFQKNTKKTFLIYNRAWSGTREYRLRFSDLLIEQELIEHCQTSCNTTDPEINVHYTEHTFKNPQWRTKNQLENFLKPTTASATSSADFDANDYNSTDIEIVLETLFDDDRLHLTEKSLRPIACAQPFILAGTHGSLEYLRSYGFRTYSEIWDESYDLIEDAETRLISITDLMKTIAQWDSVTRANKLTKARLIAEYNRRRFFSQDFFNLIVDELKTNLVSAFTELEQCNNYQGWFDRWSKCMSYPEIVEFLNTNQNVKLPTLLQVKSVIELVQNQLAEISNKKY